jgi:hypothetical protein
MFLRKVSATGTAPSLIRITLKGATSSLYDQLKTQTRQPSLFYSGRRTTQRYGHCIASMCSLFVQAKLIRVSIAWHVSGGLYITVLEQPTELQALQLPTSVADTCSAWSTWTSSNVPDQIDSGL